MHHTETAFEMSASNLRFGRGATYELGMDLEEMGVKRVLVVTDPNLAKLPPLEKVKESLKKEKIEFDVFDQVRIEPSDKSFKEATLFARDGKYDAFVAVGGGSSIDTAKAVNLYSTYPDDFLAYVNAPIGQGRPVPGPLKPLIAVPTTAGTGSETTGVAVFDLLEIHAKTGIAHRRLKPILGIVDPDNIKTLSPQVIAASGLDVLCHALESYTAIPFSQRPHPKHPVMRPAYQGSNPISDIWAKESLKILSKNLIKFFKDPQDEEAGSQMLMAASFAGMGFGNAGVHLCHGMSYPVSSMVRNSKIPGYPDDHPLIPHGMSVALNAPAVFRFTGEVRAERHLTAAKLLGADVENKKTEEAGDVLTEKIIELMKELHLPNGLSALGFTREDAIPLAKGTLPQHRVTKLSPRQASEEDLVKLFEASMVIW